MLIHAYKQKKKKVEIEAELLTTRKAFEYSFSTFVAWNSIRLIKTQRKTSVSILPSKNEKKVRRANMSPVEIIKHPVWNEDENSLQTEMTLSLWRQGKRLGISPRKSTNSFLTWVFSLVNIIRIGRRYKMKILLKIHHDNSFARRAIKQKRLWKICDGSCYHMLCLRETGWGLQSIADYNN